MSTSELDPGVASGGRIALLPSQVLILAAVIEIGGAPAISLIPIAQNDAAKAALL